MKLSSNCAQTGRVRDFSPVPHAELLNDKMACWVSPHGPRDQFLVEERSSRKRRATLTTGTCVSSRGGDPRRNACQSDGNITTYAAKGDGAVRTVADGSAACIKRCRVQFSLRHQCHDTARSFRGDARKLERWLDNRRGDHPRRCLSLASFAAHDVWRCPCLT